MGHDIYVPCHKIIQIFIVLDKIVLDMSKEIQH